jgi:hypothetical protein
MAGETRLAELDDQFVSIYETARRRLIDDQQARALIVIRDDHMLLYHGDSKPDVMTGLRPALYDKLKALGHVPLAIYCLLVGQIGGGDALPQPVLNALADYRRQVAAAGADLDTTTETAAGILPRTLDMLGRALSFLDQVIADGRVSRTELTGFCRANVANMNAIFAAAARAQVDVCHAHVMRVKENVLSADAWASLRVVIMGPHMARRDQNFLQYFSRLLHTPLDADKRVVYYEGDDIDGALDLVGTAILDFRASQSIFGDENRLHRDVLADATTRYLDELLPAADAS